MERQVFGKENSALIFCQSELQKRAYQKIYGTAESRCKLLPPGVEDRYSDIVSQRHERRERIRKQLDLTEDDKALFFVGSAFYAKGADRAIGALSALPQDMEFDAKLFIVGHNDETALRRFAARCGVEDRVFFLGSRDDVPDLLCGADLLIHPARSEAAGIVLLEAVCCGTPVLCTENCGYASLIAESEGAHLLPMPFSQKRLNRTLRLLLTVPGSLDELQQAAAVAEMKDEFFRCSTVAADVIEEKIKSASSIE
jgi:UDP-glucose:(heptosyl)LPS alpha-1,3-glucosyltransferase